MMRLLLLTQLVLLTVLVACQSPPPEAMLDFDTAYDKALTAWLQDRDEEPAETLFENAKAHGSLLEIAKAEGLLGYVAYFNNDLETAYVRYMAAYDVFEKENQQEELSLLNVRIGVIYYRASAYEKAISYLNQGFVGLAEEHNKKGVAAQYLVMCYANTGQFSMAHAVYLEAIKMNIAPDDKARLNNIMGVAYGDEGEYNMRLKMHERAEALEGRSQHEQAKSLTYLSNAHLWLANWETAEKYAQEAETLFRELGFENDIVKSRNNRAKALLKQYRLADAQAVITGTQTEFPDNENIPFTKLLEMGLLGYAQDNPICIKICDEATENWISPAILRNQDAIARAQQAIVAGELAYAYRLKEASDQRADRAQWTLAILVVALLLGTVGFLLYRRYRLNKDLYAKLEVDGDYQRPKGSTWRLW